MRQRSLLHELAGVLRDYQRRADVLGEMMRLRGESFAAWESKRRRVALLLELLEKAEAAPATVDLEITADVPAVTPLPTACGCVGGPGGECCAGERGKRLDGVMREVAAAPEVPLPSRLLARLRGKAR